MSFHTTIIKAENGAVYEGYNVRYVEKNAPEKYKFQPSVRFTADGSGTVVLEVIAKTAKENYAKVFTLNSNTSFVFAPIKNITIEIKITDFKKTDKHIEFNFFIKGCGEVPLLGKQCVERTFPVKLPMPLALAEEGQDYNMSSGDLALLLIAEQYQKCNCNH
ncbi:hypothetical protein [Kordia sp.]|uniref:hypothetical protein n=1 Tax=Kordia sp. TaxID=1965332 RepID=UPI003D6C394B